MGVFLAAALLAVLGGSGEAPGAQGRVLILESAAHPRDVTLEWLRIGNGATIQVAQQPVTLQGRTTVAAGFEERVLRIQETGRSPRSFFVPSGVDVVALDVGPPAPGGEVFGRLRSQRYQPELMRLVGTTAALDVRPDEHRIFGAAGLPPGGYEVLPVYRGGRVGKPTRVVVRAGRTVELLDLDLPETGAARLELPPSLCGASDLAMQLSGRAAREHAAAIVPGRCAIEIEGLEPGPWRLAVTRDGARNEPRAAATFEVAAGESVDVPVEPVVRVAGMVTAGGAPAAGMRLAFEQGAARWSAATDSSGTYEVMLGPPGEYAVSVLAARDLPSRSFARTYGAGDHQEDVELGLGSIEVSVRAEPGVRLDEEVQLALFESDGRRVAGRFDLREGQAVFTGLEYGRYTVTGSTFSGLRSRNHATAELGPESPAARVELVMGRGRGVLKVVGADGRPLAGARVAVGQAALIEREPGTFDLAAVARGERIVAHAPDHVPVCRILDTPDSFAVELPVADGPFTLRLAADAPWREALLSDLTGSDCPVSIDDVEPQVRAEEHAVTVVLQLPRGDFRIALGGLVHAASAPGALDIP
jgi:hypothetical protein